jgi:hypothetical protein
MVVMSICSQSLVHFAAFIAIKIWETILPHSIELLPDEFQNSVSA